MPECGVKPPPEGGVKPPPASALPKKLATFAATVAAPVGTTCNAFKKCTPENMWCLPSQ